MRRAALAAASGLLVLAPAVARACPSCAGRNDGGAGLLVALAAMILLPFAITGVLVPYLRRAGRS